MSWTSRLFLIAVLLSAGSVGVAQADEPYNSGDGIALGGYDVVAYHREGRALLGERRHRANWSGTTWHFSSEANRAAFVADPERYAPKFGGYCAWAAAEGYIAPVDPEVFHIVDGSLYLNFSRGVARRWQRDVAGNLRRGSENWPRLRAQLLEE